MVNFIKYNLKVWKIKIIIFHILFLCFLKKIKLIKFPFNKKYYFIDELNVYFKNFLQLKKKPLNSEDYLIKKEKVDILKMISQNIGKNITFINTIYFINHCKFGNCLIFLNKLIFYCEIIGCKHIILDKNIFWFLKNKINIKENNITIEIDDGRINNDNSSIYYRSWGIFFSFFNIKPEIRIYLLRKEIIQNLPKILTDLNDLYIHIRSGDIFSYCVHKPYAQPPLCFYEIILKTFKFRNIFIISENENNPIINKLINKYNDIKYIKNSIKYDIASLIYAYNIVNSISSFANSIIQLNYNLKFLWEFNIYQIKQKMVHLHHDLYNFHHKNYTIYKMEPSYNYRHKMYIWRNTKSQRKLMFKEKCVKYFIIIKNEI